MRLLWVVPALVAFAAVAACQPEESVAGAASPETQPAREPVFSDRTKQADYDHAVAAVADVRRALAGGLDPRATTELGFRCASLRTQEKGLATESDPLVGRVIADIEKTCGLDVPLASARVEIAQIERKRAEDGHASIRGECLGLKLAIGDVGAPYASNPDVADVGGKFAQYCGDASP
jgi:hypothetical protein